MTSFTGMGGFAVIIGNPPYVEYNKKDRTTKKAVSDIYKIANYQTELCGNLHAFVFERSFTINRLNGKIGVIVPLPPINTPRMSELQSITKPSKVKSQMVWISSFDERPSRLFEGVDQRLIIEIINRTDKTSLFSTKINRWQSDT